MGHKLLLVSFFYLMFLLVDLFSTKLNFHGTMPYTLPTTTCLHYRGRHGFPSVTCVEIYKSSFIVSFPLPPSSNQFSNFTGSVAKYISNLSTLFPFSPCTLLSYIHMHTHTYIRGYLFNVCVFL